MTKKVAFLRGINVGNIRIKMTDLKAAFEKMGCREVKTYLQTGNVVFESAANNAELKAVLERGLSDTFGYDAYVLLYEFDALQNIIALYPFEKEEAYHAYVIFVEKDPVLTELMALAGGLEEESKIIAAGENCIYWKVPVGSSLDTPFSKILAKAKYKSSTTVRNINTLEKMG